MKIAHVRRFETGYVYSDPCIPRMNWGNWMVVEVIGPSPEPNMVRLKAEVVATEDVLGHPVGISRALMEELDLNS